jgi:hypothetical protein
MLKKAQKRRDKCCPTSFYGYPLKEKDTVRNQKYQRTKDFNHVVKKV